MERFSPFLNYIDLLLLNVKFGANFSHARIYELKMIVVLLTLDFFFSLLPSLF